MRSFGQSKLDMDPLSGDFYVFDISQSWFMGNIKKKKNEKRY